MDFLTLALLIIAFLIGLIIKDYLPGYARKKGENLATKEDIALITREVEAVKATIERQSRLFSTKQELLMNFYDEVTAFLYELLAINFGDLPYDGGKSLYEYQRKFYESVTETTKAYQRLVVFLARNSSLLKASEQIVNCSIACRKVVSNRFGRVKFTLIEEGKAHESGDYPEFQMAAALANDANSEFWGEMKPLADKFRDSYQKFLSEMNTYLAAPK